MIMQLSKRLEKITPSETLAITKRVLEMQSDGEDVIGLGAGEPDFDTPEHIRNAAIDAINKGYTRYTANTGIPQLREAIAARFKSVNGITHHPEEIVVSCGGKHVLATAILALCDEGDEVLIPSPYWVSYPAMVRLSGAEPVFVPTNAGEGFSFDAGRLKEAITSKTKVFMFNNPVNPTGAVYGVDQTDKIAEVLKDTDVTVITDELYDSMTFDGIPIKSLATYPELEGRVITVNGASKAYAMTGWRIGYAAGPKAYISQMGKIQSHMTSNATSISQWAALAAITGSQECVRNMVATFKERRNFVYQSLMQIEGVRCHKSQGTFYIFPDVVNYYQKEGEGLTINSSVDLCKYLLEDSKVALVPGSAFGSPNHVRISFATSMDKLRQAMDRIRSGLQKLI